MGCYNTVVLQLPEDLLLGTSSYVHCCVYMQLSALYLLLKLCALNLPQ